MRIAIPTEGDFVSPHFGRCPDFTIVDVADGKLISKKTVPNVGHQRGGHGSSARLLKELGVECVISGGMGQGAKANLEQAGIKIILGVSGRIDDVIESFINGSLVGGESLCECGSTKKASCKDF